MSKANVVCRCEEIEIDEIRKWIAEGYTDFEELKRILRVGMGPCQGRGCRDIIMRELARATGKPLCEVKGGIIRLKMRLFTHQLLQFQKAVL